MDYKFHFTSTPKPPSKEEFLQGIHEWMDVMDQFNKFCESLREEKKMNKEFEVHMLNPDGVLLARQIAEIFDKTVDQLSTYCPAGREWSIVKTKLEEACFFAKKSMANDVKNQKAEE